MGDKSGERRKDYLLLGKMDAKIDTLILAQSSHDDRTLRIEEKVDTNSKDLAALKVTSAGWGFASGSISTILLYLKMKFVVG